MDNGSETYSIVNLTQKLLDSIANKDWYTYTSLTDEKLTCIEPETGNTFYEGLEFHKTYFDVENDNNIKIKENILQPSIRQITDDISIICYKRVKQISNIMDKSVKTEISMETRVWKRSENSWKLIHFHRS
jgi:hypothetical protein